MVAAPLSGNSPREELFRMDRGLFNTEDASKQESSIAPPQITEKYGSVGIHNNDSRIERQVRGTIKYKIEKTVPDFGATGWRTRQGNLLKNQQYFRSIGVHNLWNDPVHCGRNTWKRFHGPKLRTDAPLMEERDKKDKRDIDNALRIRWHNDARQETLDRFYRRKIQRMNYEAASTWAPMHVPKREIDDFRDTFDGDMNVLPRVALKKILTPAVNDRDIQAVKFITDNYEREAYIEEQWREFEHMRMRDFQTDFKRRQLYNDELQRFSGQPRRVLDEHPERFTEVDKYASKRTKELARPKKHKEPHDIADKIDYRGLYHADARYALEIIRDPSYAEYVLYNQKRWTDRATYAEGAEKRYRSVPPVNLVPHQRTTAQKMGPDGCPLQNTLEHERDIHVKRAEQVMAQIQAVEESPFTKKEKSHTIKSVALDYDKEGENSIITEPTITSVSQNDFSVMSPRDRSPVISSKQSGDPPVYSPTRMKVVGEYATLRKGVIKIFGPKDCDMNTTLDDIQKFETTTNTKKIPVLGNFFKKPAVPITGAARMEKERMRQTQQSDKSEEK